jgi:hypothetical protein
VAKVVFPFLGIECLSGKPAMPFADLGIASRAQGLGFVLGYPVVAGGRILNCLALVANE